MHKCEASNPCNCTVMKTFHVNNQAMSVPSKLEAHYNSSTFGSGIKNPADEYVLRSGVLPFIQRDRGNGTGDVIESEP